jgi:hypothetical protein
VVIHGSYVGAVAARATGCLPAPYSGDASCEDNESEEGLQMDPQEPEHNGTLDDLLAEVALTYPLTAYTAVPEDDEESALNNQILAGLVSP